MTVPTVLPNDDRKIELSSATLQDSHGNSLVHLQSVSLRLRRTRTFAQEVVNQGQTEWGIETMEVPTVLIPGERYSFASGEYSGICEVVSMVDGLDARGIGDLNGCAWA